MCPTKGLKNGSKSMWSLILNKLCYVKRVRAKKLWKKYVAAAKES